MKKTVILIDGQNLTYDLRAMRLIEKEIDWTKLFNDIVGPDSEFIRAYWFRPEKINGLITQKDFLEELIIRNKFNPHYKQYKNGGLSSVDPIIRKNIEKEYNESERWVNQQQSRFESTEKAYEQLCLTHNDIEVVKTGVVKVDSVNRDYLGEKGVDIAIAVKMIELSLGGKCDKIILVSGDYDYIEAIKFVKNNLTKFNIVSFLKANAQSSTSKGLSVIADKVIEVSEDDLKKKYAQIP